MLINLSKHLFAKSTIMAMLISVTQLSQARPDTFINAKETIIAIGDLHGDFNAMLTIFKSSEIINDNNQWVGWTKNSFK